MLCCSESRNRLWSAGCRITANNLSCRTLMCGGCMQVGCASAHAPAHSNPDEINRALPRRVHVPGPRGSHARCWFQRCPISACQSSSSCDDWNQLRRHCRQIHCGDQGLPLLSKDPKTVSHCLTPTLQLAQTSTQMRPYKPG